MMILKLGIYEIQWADVVLVGYAVHDVKVSIFSLLASW